MAKTEEAMAHGRVWDAAAEATRTVRDAFFALPPERRGDLFRQIGSELHLLDERLFVEAIRPVIAALTPEGRESLAAVLFTPQNAIGLLKDHPLWPEWERAVEENRRPTARKRPANPRKPLSSEACPTLSTPTR